MGLAVLPARLNEEMTQLKKAILNKEDINGNDELSSHATWVREFLPQYTDVNEENIDAIIKEEIGKVFLEVLNHAGVYKRTKEGQEGFQRFIDFLNS